MSQYPYRKFNEINITGLEHISKESEPKIGAVELSSLTEKPQDRRTKDRKLTETQNKQLKRKTGKKRKTMEVNKAKSAKEGLSKSI